MRTLVGLLLISFGAWIECWAAIQMLRLFFSSKGADHVD